jgi:DUF4097 and DUF4098 domain-containing protein YvlB
MHTFRQQFGFAILCCSMTLLFCSRATVSVDPEGAWDSKDGRIITQSVDFPENGRISVETVNGNISVKSWSKDRVDVTAHINTRDRSITDKEKYLKNFTLHLKKQGNKLRIETERPNSKHTSKHRKHNRGNKDIISYTIHVPRNSTMHAETVSSNIRIDDFTGVIHAATVNGSVKTTDTRGSANLEAVNGSVSITGHAGSIDGETVNGTVQAAVHALDRKDSISLETVNGSISLALDDNIHADFDIETLSGRIQTDVPLKTRHFDKHELRGTMNGGGADINLETVNGRIEVTAL